MRIVEGRGSIWAYHLSSGSPLEALCGAATMASEAPLESWGTVTHVGEKYCGECGRLAGMKANRA